MLKSKMDEFLECINIDLVDSEYLLVVIGSFRCFRLRYYLGYLILVILVGIL